MLKKITLVLLAVLALGVGFIAVKFLIPIYTVLDKARPGSAPRDLVLQDDSRVEAPFGNAHPPDVEPPSHQFPTPPPAAPTARRIQNPQVPGDRLAACQLREKR